MKTIAIVILSAMLSVTPTTPMETQTEPISVLNNSSTKSYMSYEMITDKTSDQWKLINSDEIQIDERGFLKTDDGFVGVALGSYFGGVGEKFIFTLDTGVELKVIKVEEKADCDTCENHIVTADGSVIEFVVDTSTEYMMNNVRSNGYIFNGNFNNTEEFKGHIVKIERLVE